MGHLRIPDSPRKAPHRPGPHANVRGRWGRLGTARSPRPCGSTAAFRLGLGERGINFRGGGNLHHRRPPGHRRPGAPEYSGRGPRGLPRCREPAPSLKALALAAGRKELHQGTWRHVTKAGIGLDHFEGRSFNCFHRHLTLDTAARLFITRKRLATPKVPAAGTVFMPF